MFRDPGGVRPLGRTLVAPSGVHSGTPPRERRDWSLRQSPRLAAPARLNAKGAASTAPFVRLRLAVEGRSRAVRLEWQLRDRRGRVGLGLDDQGDRAHLVVVAD